MTYEHFDAKLLTLQIIRSSLKCFKVFRLFSSFFNFKIATLPDGGDMWNKQWWYKHVSLAKISLNLWHQFSEARKRSKQIKHTLVKKNWTIQTNSNFDWFRPPVYHFTWGRRKNPIYNARPESTWIVSSEVRFSLFQCQTNYQFIAPLWSWSGREAQKECCLGPQITCSNKRSLQSKIRNK